MPRCRRTVSELSTAPLPGTSPRTFGARRKAFVTFINLRCSSAFIVGDPPLTAPFIYGRVPRHVMALHVLCTPVIHVHPPSRLSRQAKTTAPLIISLLDTHAVNMPAKQVKVGVFIPGECQLLDASCIDILAMASTEYLELIPFLPQHVRDLSSSVSISYISNEDVIPMTAGFNVQATHDLSHPDVQPGKLDVLLVPGPDPSATWDKKTLEFLSEHAQVETTDVLSVCTGILLCAAAGITDGKKVCGPRGMQGDLRKKYPGTNFVGKKYRWTQDGNLRSGGKSSDVRPRRRRKHINTLQVALQTETTSSRRTSALASTFQRRWRTLCARWRTSGTGRRYMIRGRPLSQSGSCGSSSRPSLRGRSEAWQRSWRESDLSVRDMYVNNCFSTPIRF